MRIMQIVSGGGVNGAIMHCCQLTRHLAARGHEITLVCRPNAWIGKQLAETPSVEVIPSPLIRWPTTELKRMAGVARARGIDVVHTHQSRAHFFGVLLRWFAGTPCVATAHNRYVQPHWMFNNHVLANSAATRKFHRWFNLVPGRKIETVHCFIETERFTNLPTDTRQKIREELNVPQTAPLIGIFGDVIPRKGHLYLVQAMAEVLAKHPSARLLVVGNHGHDEAYTQKVRAEAARLSVADAIHWAGYRSDVPQLMASLDVCASAALEEPLGLTILEAMASNLPTVASAVGGLKECVTHEETGLLVPAKRPKALADALVRLLGDAPLRQKMGSAGRAKVLAQFSPEIQLARTEEIYERVAGKRGRWAA